ncbi:hypothetical protein MHYP_G00072930, partial [Metynnis hypsauchen]
SGAGHHRKLQSVERDGDRAGGRSQCGTGGLGAGGRTLSEKLLRHLTVLRSEQPDQRGLRQRLSKHGLREDLLHLHHADR